ncbi:MAG: PAS domain-containing sensor histidine kinase [Ramlibacter sp.]
MPFSASDSLGLSTLGSDPGNAAALLAGVLDSAMDAVITVDSHQKIVLYNRTAEKMFGWLRPSVLGQPLDKLIPERFRLRHTRDVELFGATGVTSRRMGGITVIHGLRSNGEEFPVDASISQLDTQQGKLYTVILRDVTERVRAQEEHSEFAAAAHAIREEEKRRVARELHDELAQSLTALKMDTIWLRDNTRSAGDESVSKFEGMLVMLDHAVAATRRIAADLRPLMLDDLGLVPAIEWLVVNFQQRNGVASGLQVDDELELREPYATAVFRIVQESLANVGKHANATKVTVAVAYEDEVVKVVVEDNGQGFSTSAPRKSQSLGLMGMRERAQLLEGTAAIESAPGRGTRVEVLIPLRATEGAA